MRRRRRLILVLIVVLPLFAAVSVLMARGLMATSVERGAVTDLIKAEAFGNSAAMLAQLPSCLNRPPCVKGTRQLANSLRRAGKLQILSFEPSMQFALAERSGVARVAWRVDQSTPVAQCIHVKRTGPLAGADVELLSLSKPLRKGESCE